jgi:hypothetical protein
MTVLILALLLFWFAIGALFRGGLAVRLVVTFALVYTIAQMMHP